MTEYRAHRGSWEPAHPGILLRDDVLPSLGLSVSGLARRLKVSRQMLHKVMNGTAAVTPEMALKLGKFCGNGPTLWLRMQQAYDLWHAEKRLAAELETIETHKAAA